MSVSWESLNSHVQRNDLFGYEVSHKFLKLIDEGVIISSGNLNATNIYSVFGLTLRSDV